MDDNPTEEFTFPHEDIEKRVYDIMDRYLKNQPYKDHTILKLQNTIGEKIIEYLVNKNINYKFIVNCMVMQRMGAGFITSSANYWDSNVDQTMCIPWPNEREVKKDAQSKLVRAITTIYAVNF